MVFLNKKQTLGQTLIETMAALFILVMGISATVGLAVYAFSSSTNINKEIVATGLAREGLEAVRNMRDTNWLKDALGTTASGTNCYVYNNATGTSSCYPNWLGGGAVPYCLDPVKNTGTGCSGTGAAVGSFFLGFNSSVLNPWVLVKDTGSKNFGLQFDGNFPDDLTTGGFYSPASGITCSNGNPGISDYCRKIIITKDSSGAPYNTGDASLILLKVQSQVWWVDKKCPRSPDFINAPVSCKIELDTYLTNWKNYSVTGS